jgi:hypothetical protein
MIAATERYFFLLAVLLLIAVYYVGLNTELGTAGKAVNNLLLTATGRTSAGTFAAYPKVS